MKSGLMLKRAIDSIGKPPKAIAAEINYSVDAIHKTLQGKRRIPQDPNAKQKIAGMSLLAWLAVVIDTAGYSPFGYIDGDRHPQTMLRRVEKEDHEADKALREHNIAWRTIDKNRPEDLSSEDIFVLTTTGIELLQRAEADINLVMEWDETYRLGIVDILTGKKEIARVPQPQATYNF